jgi:cyclase
VEAIRLRETALSDRLVVLTLGGDRIETGWGVNCTAFASAAGTLVVDPMIAPSHARLVEEALRRRGFPAVRHVVLTHHHTDHAVGAGWFASRGAAVIATATAGLAMAERHPSILAARRRDPGLGPLFADAAPVAPAIGFAGSHVVDLGDALVEAIHLGPGHTPGDAVVLFPSERVVACGDLVFAGTHFNYEEADAAALPRRLEDLAALPASRFVPGHGPVGGPELLEAQARYHAEVARLVRAAPGAEAARAAVEAAFPDHALRETIPTAVAAFRGGAMPAW